MALAALPLAEKGGKAASDVAERFWGGLLKALRHEAYASETRRVGRKVAYRRRKFAGQQMEVETAVPLVDDKGRTKRVRTRKVSVPVWAIPVGATAAYLLAQRAKGNTGIVLHVLTLPVAAVSNAWKNQQAQLVAQVLPHSTASWPASANPATWRL